MIRRINHAVLFVSDLARALSFYESVLDEHEAPVEPLDLECELDRWSGVSTVTSDTA